MKRKITSLTTAIIVLFLMLFTWPNSSLGQNYSVATTALSSVSVGDLVVWGTSPSNLAKSCSNNWIYLSSTGTEWLVFKVVSATNGFYLQNTANDYYVYSSAEKKVAFDASNKTILTINNNDLVYGGANIGSYVYNSTGLRPYKSGSYTNAYLYAINCTVTYNTNGGSGIMTDSNSPYKGGATVTTKTNTFGAPSGKAFDHWNTEADDSGTSYNEGDEFSISENTILYAIWVSASSDPIITVSTDELEDFSYIVDNGPSTAKTFTVSGVNLKDDIEMSFEYGYFELSTDNSTYSSELTLSPTNSSVTETTVYIRMVKDMDADDYLDELSITSTDADGKSILLSGIVIDSHTLTYSASNGSISGVNGSSVTVNSGDKVAEGATVTLTAAPSLGYKFTGWSVEGEGSTLSSSTDNPTTFTMGTANSTVTASFAQAYAITISASIENGSVVSSSLFASAGETITLTATPESGYSLRAFVVTKAGDFVHTTSTGTNTATFTMPTEAVCVSALFKVNSATTWQSTTLASLTGDDVFVIVGNNGLDYAMTNDKGTSNPPAASSVTVANGKIISTVNDNMMWNVGGNATDGYVFYPNGNSEKWLYCINNNNGLRVGTGDDKTFEINNSYIYNKGQSRYIGVYSSQDWRSYTSINNNITGQTFAFYKQQAPQPEVAVSIAALSGFTYVAGNGPSTRQAFSVCGDNLTHDVTISLENTNFEISTDGTTYQTTTITLSKGEGTMVELTPIYVRLKSGLDSGNYSCNITVASEDATGSEVVALTGDVKQIITIDDGITHGTVTASTSLAIAGETVTLTIEPETNYSLKTLKVYKTGDATTEVTVTNNQFTMPTYAVTVTATFVTSYTITYKANYGTESDIVRDFAGGNDATIEKYDLFTREGMVIERWNTSQDGNGTDYAADAIIYNISADYILYAIWRDIQYHITFDVNGNTTTIAGIDVDYGDNTGDLPSATMEGYTHIGWALTPDGTKVSDPYTPTGTTEDITLYAIFAMVIEDGINITTSTSGIGNSYASNSEFAIDDYQFKCSDICAQENCIQTKTTGYIYNDDNYSFGKITSIIVTYGTDSRSVVVKVGTEYNPTSSSELSGVQDPNNNNIYIFTPDSNNDYGYVLIGAKTSTIRIASIVINYESSAQIITVNNEQTISDDIEATDHIVVTNGGVLTFNGANNGDATNLIIEDGGQLITNSSIPLTYKKQITSAAKDGGWYTISTPVHTASNTFLKHESVENLILEPQQYDFFYYDEPSNYWRNYKKHEFDLNVSQGYLYRNNGAELHFAGYNNQATYYEIALSYASTEPNLRGFNLIGNPYPQNITMSDVTVNNEGTLTGGYVLSNAGAWSAEVAATIAPAQGFLVQIDKAGVTARITKPTGGSKSRANHDYLKFIVANSQYEDAAFVLFEEGYGLNKIDHRNADIPMLYVLKDKQNFAIATMSDDTKSFNLNFKAMTTGKYTLSYKVDGNFSYLHVIDRLTGEDVDMLLEGEYSFIASPIDSENRFIVRLEYSAGSEISESSVFAYQSGNDIIVNGEGELQIFDMMGRRVLTQYVSGVETINLQSHGVYIFKLNEKTQKIVVK